MALSQFPKSPNKVHPTVPSAVGSHISLFQEGRDKHFESKEILSDSVDKVMNHIADKLPEDVLERLDVMSTIKDKLYNYMNQQYQNMFNRYMVTSEDEMVKKVRNFVDKEETKTLARYTPKEVAELLDQVGGADKFNTGEVEKSMVNMYGHLQGHIQRGVNDLENETNSLLRQKTDVGAFVRGENAYSIVKCTFKDSEFKPKTVYDVKLSVNILDSELISPVVHYQTTVEYLLKEVITGHLMDMIDREIQDYKDELVDAGKGELSDGEIMFEKIKRIEKFTDDDKDDEKSKRYTILAKRFLDKVENLRAEIDPAEYDALNLRENIKRIIDNENIRNRGFNTAINALTSILDTSKLGYQVADNMKNSRYANIREYDETNAAELPDERYGIVLAYFDQSQLREMQKQYDQQMAAFLEEINQVWEVLTSHYELSKRTFGLKLGRIKDFQDYADKIMKRTWRREKEEYREDPETIPWYDLGYKKPEDTYVEKSNRTYLAEKEEIQRRVLDVRKKLQDMHGFQNPVERVVIEERLNFIDRRFNEFNYRINPHHLQPGLLLDVDLSTVKKKQFMLKSMANVLNEFLSSVSKGFADAAFASFKRRRSTVREDIDQSFGEDTDTTGGTFKEAYSKMQDEMDADQGKKSANLKGSVDISPKKSKGASGLKEL